jgi:hypothetical protein
MDSRIFLVLAFSAISVFEIGCTPRSALLGIEVPASAKNVEFLHPTANDTGIKFTLQVEPSSYKYVNEIRSRIATAGYALCKKSAISTWQPFPNRDGNKPTQPKYWLVEMYAAQDMGKFVLLRVDEDMTAGERLATQKFLVASQSLSSGEPNLSNVSEFCELTTRGK